VQPEGSNAENRGIAGRIEKVIEVRKLHKKIKISFPDVPKYSTFVEI
jgi:hypothetical protein